MSVVVEARFAGGPILIDTATLDGRGMVELTLPGSQRLLLFEHEADALAHALRDRGKITEDGFNRDDAAEIVAIATSTDGPDTVEIVVLDDAGNIAQNLDRNRALALAGQLLELAQGMPEPRRILRRSHETAEQFDRVADLY